MKILDIHETLQGCVATVGSFDGIHLGHREIFRELKKIALEKNLPDIVISFRQHPRFIVQPEYKMKLLTTIDEKISLLKQQNISFIHLLDFDKKMAELTAEEFVKKILIQKLNVKALIVGFNHRFGKGRGAGFNELVQLGDKYGFSVHKVKPVLYKNEYISSSRIRKELENCHLEEANSMLGYQYFFTGKVIQGKKLGKKIGIPTANLSVDKRKLLPCPGVYAVVIDIDKTRHKGVLNYGRRPTIDNDTIAIPEVHILDFDKDIYGKTIKVTFVKRLRQEMKFSSVDELKRQIREDIEITRHIFN